MERPKRPIGERSRRIFERALALAIDRPSCAIYHSADNRSRHVCRKYHQGLLIVWEMERTQDKSGDTPPTSTVRIFPQVRETPEQMLFEAKFEGELRSDRGPNKFDPDVVTTLVMSGWDEERLMAEKHGPIGRKV